MNNLALTEATTQNEHSTVSSVVTPLGFDFINQGQKYFDLLRVMCRFSRFFSDSQIPYLNYRVVENAFCEGFNAENLSRSDTAFDAKIRLTDPYPHHLGIGIKTFTCPNGHSLEKVAEFNQLSPQLSQLSGKDLAIQLATLRNERIRMAYRNYDITSAIYHIVARQQDKLVIFNTDYDCIDICKIHNVKQQSNGNLIFVDDKNEYRFNRSKSTLYRRFIIPAKVAVLDVYKLDNPFELLMSCGSAMLADTDLSELPPIIDTTPPSAAASQLDLLGEAERPDYVVLPLYSLRGGRHVPLKSGINQWNAGGRARSFGEVYIPIPSLIHNHFPDFFPHKDQNFELILPTGERLQAKVCQQDRKALMTNPNAAIANWLLRSTLNLKEGQLATIEYLDELGVDSVMIIKEGSSIYRIDIMPTDSYEAFSDKYMNGASR